MIHNFMQEYGSLIVFVLSAVGAYLLTHKKRSRPKKMSYKAMLGLSAAMEHELNMMPHSSKDLVDNCQFCFNQKLGKYLRGTPKPPSGPGGGSHGIIQTGSIDGSKIQTGYITTNKPMSREDVEDLKKAFKKNGGKSSYGGVIYLPEDKHLRM